MSLSVGVSVSMMISGALLAAVNDLAFNIRGWVEIMIRMIAGDLKSSLMKTRMIDNIFLFQLCFCVRKGQKWRSKDQRIKKIKVF